MKRILSFALAVLMIATLATTFVFADAATKVNAKLDSKTGVEKGKEVTLYVTLDKTVTANKAASISFDVPDDVTVVSSKWECTVPESPLNLPFPLDAKNKGVLALGGDFITKEPTPVTVTAGSKLFKIVVKVNDGAALTKKEIKVNVTIDEGGDYEVAEGIGTLTMVCKHANMTGVEYTYDDTNHWKVCPDCSAKVSSAKHAYASDCADKCKTCGAPRAGGAKHTAAKAWTYDEINHWHACTKCKTAIDTAAHTFDQKVEKATYLASNATCSAPKKYYYSCVCGAKGTDTFDVGTPDPSQHVYTPFVSDQTGEKQIVCDSCVGGEITVIVAENTKEIEGLKLGEGSEGVLTKDMKLVVTDVTKAHKKDTVPEGLVLASAKQLQLTIEQKVKDSNKVLKDDVGMPTNATVTLKKPAKYTNLQVIVDWKSVEYVDNGDGTVSFNVPGNCVVLFAGKATAKATSDNTMTATWIVLLAVAVLGFAATIVASKKKANR